MPPRGYYPIGMEKVDHYRGKSNCSTKLLVEARGLKKVPSGSSGQVDFQAYLLRGQVI